MMVTVHHADNFLGFGKAMTEFYTFLEVRHILSFIHFLKYVIFLSQ